MTEFWAEAIRYVLSGMLGWAAGSVLNYRRAKVAGVSLLVPFVSKSSRNFTIIVIVLSAMTMFSVISGQIQRQHAIECEAEFQRVLTRQADINGEDRALERRDDDLRDARDDALDGLVKGLIAGPERGEVIGLLTRYDQFIETNNAERDALERERNSLQEQREADPYPAPRCD